MKRRILVRIVSSTALLAVTLTGLETGLGLTGGSAVAMAAAVDDPPPAGQTPPADQPSPPGDGMPSFDPDEPPPPGFDRYVPPPDPNDPDAGIPDETPPGETDPGEDTRRTPPDPTTPEETPPDQTTPAEPAPLAPGPRPGTGPALLKPGDKGLQVKKLQVRLQRLGLYDIPVTGLYGRQTTRGVRKFQAQQHFVGSGVVDAATLKALYSKGGKVGARAIAAGEDRPYGSQLASSCLTGNVVCVDKTGRTVRWVVDGKVRMTLDARFGGYGTPTREGVFHIYWKDADHVSKEFGSSMPYAMFFSGGQAVHYSSDFAARGYSGASHGCVNTRQYSKMRKLFELASVGDRVVVYESRPIKG